MKPVSHVAISAVAGSVLFLVFKSWAMVGACFLGGVFIDIDHYWDYYLHQRHFPFDYRKLSAWCKNFPADKVYLLFHSYELLSLLWIAIFVLGLSDLWIGLAVGTTIHVLCDQFVNPVRPLGYFLIFRIIFKFKRNKILHKTGLHPGGGVRF